MIKTLALSSIEIIGNGLIGATAGGLGFVAAMFINEYYRMKVARYSLPKADFFLLYIGSALTFTCAFISIAGNLYMIALD